MKETFPLPQEFSLEKQVDILKQEVRMLQLPLAHGTTSNNIESILDNGLFAQFPGTTIAQTKSATDLLKPDGLLGAYCFAKINSDDLETKNDEDVVDRYLQINKVYPEEGRQELSTKFEHYRDKRKDSGYPVVFIGEGSGFNIHYNNPRIPSEVELTETIPPNQIKVMLVPKKHIDEVKNYLIKKELGIHVLPIEILEKIDTL